MRNILYKQFSIAKTFLTNNYLIKFNLRDYML